MHVVERFAAWAGEYRKGPIAAGVLHHAKRAVIDWYAALFPGAVVAPAILLEKSLAEELDRGAARFALVAGRPVREAEANPLIVKRDGVVAVDALAVMKEE